MPRHCTICDHRAREAIEHALVAGEPFRHIAAQYGTSATALVRHKHEHIAAGLTHARAAQDATRAQTVLADIRALQGKALGILQQAEAAGALGTALHAIREARACLELMAKLEGALQEAPSTLLILPAWQGLRSTLLTALEPYPQARQAVVHALTHEVAHGPGV